MPLVLQDIQPPESEVLLIQPQVVVYWERDCLGMGTLYLSVRTAVWISDQMRKGFRLTYRAISVHAAASANEDFPEPCLLFLIDVNKTDIEYTSDVENVEDETEDDDDTIKTASIRFIPSDPSAISKLYETLNECQAQNPEMDDDMSDEDQEEDDTALNCGNGGDADDSGRWYTAESGGEIRLSAEGRANLERVVGNLNDIPDDTEQLNSFSSHRDDDVMEEE